MKKIAVVTGARSEYGLLRWVIDEIHHATELQLQLIVTGGHLSPEQGLTYRCIEEDGYDIDAKVDMLLSSDCASGIAKSMGMCSIGMSDAFLHLQPDMIVVLGDRYELLPIVGTALVMRIPIAHISGGDITEGAIDNEVRNAVTMMSTLHFPGTQTSAARIGRMIGTMKNVFVVGETNLDNFIRLPNLSRIELADSLGMDADKPWILMTYHPVTKESCEKNLLDVQTVLDVLQHEYADYEIIITRSNADIYGSNINQLLVRYVESHSNFHLYASLGQLRYVSILSQLYCMVGNSSSGIYESGYWHLPTLNIGHRQDGRFMTSNIICCENDRASIQEAFHYMQTVEYKKALTYIDNPYGDGNASKRIVEQIKQYFNSE